MQLILALVIGLLLVFIFWFIGHIIKKVFNFDFSEENQLLKELINIGLGASAFLIIINLIGSIVRDFNIALIVTLIIIIGIGFWQKEETLKMVLLVKEYSNQDKLKEFFKQHTDKYFWILIGVINFIYASTAFSNLKWDRTGLGNAHIFNINHLIAGNYPPKYSFLSSIAQKYHYGSDILGAVISKLSTCHAEISLDLLLLIFLNLSILAIYALTVKYQNTNPINKYLVPFAAFLAWGPITNLFSKTPAEVIPQKFFEKVVYLTQTRLIDSANWSGLVLNWFFSPPIGLGVFFFLIAIYLLFRFFEGERNTKFSILLGVFLSSFVIIDFTKFIILIFGVFIYLFLSPIPLFDDTNEETSNKWKALLKNLGIVLGIAIILGFIHGNWLRLGKDYSSLITYFNLGTSAIDKSFGPLNTNIILLAIYGLGFYQAHKLKQNWVFFTLPFFLASYIISFFISVPNAGVGKIMMAGNLIAAFSLPFSIEFLKEQVDKQFKLDENKVKIFYGLVFFMLSFSTLIYWGFGDKEKPLFRFESGKLSYSGGQVLPKKEEIPTIKAQDEEYSFVQHLKSKNVNGQTIVAEIEQSNTFANFASLNTITSRGDNIQGFPIKRELTPNWEEEYRNSFSLGSDFWKKRNIRWLYLTPWSFKFMMPPQGRIRFLDAYLKNAIELGTTNKQTHFVTNLKELYQVNPHKLSNENPVFVKDLEATGAPFYINYSKNCPYIGVYNFKSNDFDGDMIADIAFYDQIEKKWIVINGKDQKERVIDLKNNILRNADSELLTPIPSDYDGDGKTDIALFKRSTAQWLILKSSNNELFTYRWTWAFGEIPLPADIDGDGKADILAYYNGKDHSDWHSRVSKTDYTDDLKTFDGSSYEIPGVGDFDGDSKADPIIYRPDLGSFQVYPTSKCATKPSTQALGCGIAASNKPLKLEIKIGSQSSRPVLADYDGDTRIDLATWTPENGKWEIIFAKNITDDSLQDKKVDQVLTFGKAGNIPVPGDYDGDGKADIALLNFITGSLEIVNSSDGSRKIQDFGKFKKLTLASLLGW